MDALGRIAQASRRLPPRASNETETSLTAATPTAAIATGVPADKGMHFTIAVSVAFNIRFGDSGVTNPADTAAFVAGVYDFFLAPTDTFYKVTANANGKCKSWISSEG